MHGAHTLHRGTATRATGAALPAGRPHFPIDREHVVKALVDIVDDDPGNQKLLRVLVERAGGRARVHADGAAALAAMRARPPAVAVLDVQLPGVMDGIALTRTLKAAPETARVVVAVVSASATLGDERRARLAGCDYWLAKPIDIRAFLEWLSWQLGGPDAA